MAQIGTLLNEQANWAAVNRTSVTGSIEGNAVTLEQQRLSPRAPAHR